MHKCNHSFLTIPVFKRGVLRIQSALFLSLVLLTFSMPKTADAYVLVTDVDDTIKVSHVTDPVNRVIRFVAHAEPFAGMATLYGKLLANQSKPEFAVISGTPKLLGYSVQWFLEYFGFPEPNFFETRPAFTDVAEFKATALNGIFGNGARNGQFVTMVGDDTQSDPEVYEDAAQAYNIKPQIYIRRVTNRGVSAGIQYFDSAADLAVLELMAGRLTEADVEAVFSDLETARELDQFSVPGEYCPNSASPRLSSEPRVAGLKPGLMNRWVAIETKMRKLCARTGEWFTSNSVRLSLPPPQSVE